MGTNNNYHWNIGGSLGTCFGGDHMLEGTQNVNEKEGASIHSNSMMITSNETEGQP